MMRAVLIATVIVAASVIVSCTYVGPPAVAACLNDQRVMSKYMTYSASNPWRVLVGGISKQGGNINCYWGEDNFGDFFYDSAPYRRCTEDSTDCTMLARGSNIRFVSNQRAQANMDVVWFLIGSFAAGAAQGLASASTIQSNSPVIASNNKSPTPSIRCTPRPISLTISGAPEYVCR